MYVYRFLLQNTHRVTVVMIPDSSLEAAQLEAEVQELAAAKAAMSDEEIQNIINATEQLKAAQATDDSEEDKATIPRLSR